MNCIVVIDGKFVLNKGKVSSHHLTYDRFWKKYLDIFESVTIVGRLYSIEDPTTFPVEGLNVRFISLPGCNNIGEYIFKFLEIQKSINSIDFSNSALIFRVPAITSILILNKIRQIRHPFALEVVADPYDAFAPHSYDHPLRPFIRWWFTRKLRQQCQEACAVAYVSQDSLQRRYPPRPQSFSTHYSSIKLVQTDILIASRLFRNNQKKFTLIFVGSLEQLYKGPDILISALAINVSQKMDLKLVIVGDGKYRSEIETQALQFGIKDRVFFTGRLPAGKAIYQKLDNADLFVLPSRQEGLPRAMIEAMSRALPCIGSTIGGIPELLPDEDLVLPDNATALATKIRDVLTDSERMTAMSARNLEKAKEYCEDNLRKRRINFYQSVQEKTQEWIKSQLV